MSKFHLVVLIVAACLSGMIIDHRLVDSPKEITASASDSDNLYIWYAGYNDEYFGDNLPRDTVITQEKIDSDSLANTVFNKSDKRFHIRFNSMYPIGSRLSHLILLHEQCHIETYDEPMNDNDAEPDHGPRWRACMLRLETMGAWRRLLIDNYKGN